MERETERDKGLNEGNLFFLSLNFNFVTESKKQKLKKLVERKIL